MAIVCAAAVALSLGCAAGSGGGGAAKGVSGPLSALPEAGQCRLWSPDKREQGPSVPCSELQGKVKSGDWMLTRGKANSGDVQVFVYGDFGVIKETYLLDAATGKSK
jgi:hypothetical protein